MLLLLQPTSTYSLPLPSEVEALRIQLREALSADHLCTPMEQHRILHQFLMSLWQRQWHASSHNPFPCPTIRFLILISLQSDGGHAEPDYMTGYFAKLKYCIRLAFLHEIKRVAQERYHGVDYHACLELEPWFQEGIHSPFDSICSLQHMASAIAMGTMRMPRIWWEDPEHHEKMIFQGHHIAFSDIRQMFAAMEQELITLWQQHILLGITDLRVDYSDSIREDLSNTTVGYSFLDDPLNTFLFGHSSQKLLAAILARPALRDHFIHSVGSDPQWDRLALRRWLEHYSRLSLLLLVRCEMLSGGPGRGTELTSMSYRSTQTRRRRNLSILGSHLAIIRTYQKSTALSGKDKLIPHSLDAVSTDIMLQDLLLVRPFATWAATMCYPSEADAVKRLYQYKLFINQHKLFTSDDLSNAMRHFTLRSLGIGLTINPWRHIAISFRRHLCPTATAFFEKEAESEETAAILQLGHSRQIENMHYAVTSHTLQGSSEDILPFYLEASTHWQLSCRVVPGKLLHLNSRVEARGLPTWGPTFFARGSAASL